MPTAPEVVALLPATALLAVARRAGQKLTAIDERAIAQLAALPVEQLVGALAAVSRETLAFVCRGLELDARGDARELVTRLLPAGLFNFLATVLSFGVAAWEELSIFLNLLVPKLPAPKEEDHSKGLLETIDLDSYRLEVRATQAIKLAADEGEVGPVPVGGGALRPEPELEYLSMIVRQFNELFGNIEWKDKEQIAKLVTEEIPKRVAADEGYQNAVKNSDRQNAKIEHDRALEQVIVDLVTDHAELFKQFSEHGDFKKWLTEHSFRASSFNTAGV